MCGSKNISVGGGGRYHFVLRGVLMVVGGEGKVMKLILLIWFYSSNLITFNFQKRRLHPPLPDLRPPFHASSSMNPCIVSKVWNPNAVTTRRRDHWSLLNFLTFIRFRYCHGSPHQHPHPSPPLPQKDNIVWNLFLNLVMKCVALLCKF